MNDLERIRKYIINPSQQSITNGDILIFEPRGEWMV
jgi:hypothetical protein